MDQDQLAAGVRAFVEGVNSGEPGIVDAWIARRFYDYEPGPDDVTATEVWNDFLAELRRGLPDLQVQVDDLHPAADGQLAGTVTVRGTHTQPIWGAPATGTVVTWQPQVSVRPVDDHFAVRFEGITTPDMLGLLRQLGLVNPPDEMHLPSRNADARPPEFVLRLAFNGGVAPRHCSHLGTATILDSDVTVCEECVASGDVWPALRLCVSCGYVGCCDTSINKHMKRHAEETGHVLMRSIRPGEGWMWCYADNAFFDSRTLARMRAGQVRT